MPSYLAALDEVCPHCACPPPRLSWLLPMGSYDVIVKRYCADQLYNYHYLHLGPLVKLRPPPEGSLPVLMVGKGSA